MTMHSLALRGYVTCVYILWTLVIGDRLKPCALVAEWLQRMPHSRMVATVASLILATSVRERLKALRLN